MAELPDSQDDGAAVGQRTVSRPWGTYTVLEERHEYKLKRLTVVPGGRLSLQLHRHRREHWVVVAGLARVTCGDRQYTIGVGEDFDIPRGAAHRLENPGEDTLEVIEVQHGSYLGEDDIVRLQDDYGRSGPPSPALPRGRTTSIRRSANRR